MGSQQILTGFVHGVKIQLRVAALPGIIPQERVLLSVYEIGIFTAPGTETGVQVFGHGRDRMNHYLTGQHGI